MWRLVKFITRFAILGVIAYVMMVRLRAQPVWMLIGASSLVAAAALEAVRAPDPRDQQGTRPKATRLNEPVTCAWDLSDLNRLQEAFDVSKRSVLTTFFLFLVLGIVAPAYAQEAAPGGTNSELVKWSIITAGFALGIAAGLAAIGQGMSVSKATEALARNPSAAGEIRGALILGLVLIESLVIYVLLISLILFFIQPFGAQ